MTLFFIILGISLIALGFAEYFFYTRPIAHLEKKEKLNKVKMKELERVSVEHVWYSTVNDKIFLHDDIMHKFYEPHLRNYPNYYLYLGEL